MINADKPYLWNDDTKRSVLQYNNWFINFAPKAFQVARKKCTDEVNNLFIISNYLYDINSELLEDNPNSIIILRMLCAPPIARDRLAGLSDVSPSKIKKMEEGSLPKKNKASFISSELPKIVTVINSLLDKELFPWLANKIMPKDDDVDVVVAKAVVTDRLSGVTTDPVIRNYQEIRQLNALKEYLENKGYTFFRDPTVDAFRMPHGTFAFHKNVKMFKNAVDDSSGYVNTPIDVVVMPMDKSITKPYLIECKSAGDFTNTNKRRKEEDTKINQLRATYGDDIILYLFLCGYFDASYLGYEAANHMDWIWEHRIDDLERLGI